MYRRRSADRYVGWGSSERMVTPKTRAEDSEIGPMFLQRRIFLSFCATMLIGVLLCTVYLARRATSSAPRAKTSAFSVQAGGADSAERNSRVILRPAPPPTPSPAA